MKYSNMLHDIESEQFHRQNVLDAFQKANPNYNIGSFNRHFSKLVTLGYVENVGRDLYIAVNPNNAKPIYIHNNPSEELLDVESFIATEMPLADFLVWELVQLNEFINHQIAQNMIIVMVEHMLVDAVFERLKDKYKSVILTPKPEELQRYGGRGSVIVERLSSRYPRNHKQQHGYAVEKLIVDLFAEKTVKAVLNVGDYPDALETIFKHYRVNETKLFNYAKARYVYSEIRMMIKNKTAIELYTDKENKRNAEKK